MENHARLPIAIGTMVMSPTITIESVDGMHQCPSLNTKASPVTGIEASKSCQPVETMAGTGSGQRFTITVPPAQAQAQARQDAGGKAKGRVLVGLEPGQQQQQQQQHAKRAKRAQHQRGEAARAQAFTKGIASTENALATFHTAR